MNAKPSAYESGIESFIHSPHPYLALTAAALLIGLLAAHSFAYLRYREGRESENWPVATGKIESSEITERKNHGKKEYLISLKYAFEVEGRTYRSNRVSSESDTIVVSAAKGESQPEKYKLGSACEVHYGPDDPRRAVLEPGVEAGAPMPMVVSAAITALAAAIALCKALSDFRCLSEIRRSAELFEEFKSGLVRNR